MAAVDLPEIPVGTPVRYWTGCRPDAACGTCSPAGKTSRTRSATHLLGGHTPVVWVEDEASCIALTHVEVLEPSPENRPAGTGTCPSCNQHRVLWEYTPDHQLHWDEGARLRCHLCQFAENGGRVLLCVDCRTREIERAEAAPLDPADATILRLVAAQSGPEPASVPVIEERRAS